MSLGALVGMVPDEEGQQSEREVIVAAVRAVEKGDQGHDQEVKMVVACLFHTIICESFVLCDKISNLLNLLQMKPSEQKLAELTKLKQLAPYPIDSSFITGYLAYAVPLQLVPEVRDMVTQIILMVQEQLISSHNMLELLIVLRYDLLEAQITGKKKTLGSTLEPYLSQLALDNSYLSRRHFQKEFRPEDIVPQSLGIECGMCLVDIITSELSCLACGHMYHKKCLAEYSKEKIISKHIPFNCPNEDCRNQITQDQINEYLPKDLREKYEQFTFHNYVEKHMEDTSWCPTPGCSAVFAFDAALTDYKCPACKKHYCLACKCEFHTGLSCQDYKQVASLNEEDRKFMMLVKGAKFKQCPNCKFWVEKNEGCDHMTCRCKYEFCYVCGGKYNRCKCKGFVNEVEEPRLLLPMSQIRPIQPLPEIEIGRRLPLPIPSQIRIRSMSQSDSDGDLIQPALHFPQLFRASSRKEIEERRRRSEQQRIRQQQIAASENRRARQLLRRQRKVAQEAKLLQELRKEEEARERKRKNKQQRQAEQERHKSNRFEVLKQQREESRRREVQHEEMQKSAARFQRRNKELVEEEKKRQAESNARSLRIKEAESIRLKLQEQRERIQSQLKARDPRQIEAKPAINELRKASRLETQLMPASRSEKIEEKQVEQKSRLDDILKKYWNKSPAQEKKEPANNEPKYSFSYINFPNRSKPNQQVDRKNFNLKQVQRQRINSKDDNQRQLQRFPIFSFIDSKSKEASRLHPYDNA